MKVVGVRSLRVLSRGAVMAIAGPTNVGDRHESDLALPLDRQVAAGVALSSRWSPVTKIRPAGTPTRNRTSDGATCPLMALV